jgi:hypothetical protein
VFKKLKMNKLQVVFFVSFFLSVIGCEQTFQPIDKTDDVFSMYGVLDVHSDTQWVRVMPIGGTLLPENPTDLGVEVRLIRESTSETTVLYDSLFNFSGDTYVRNYMLPDSVYPEEVYTIIASNQEGEESTVVLDTPSYLEIPEVDENNGKTIVRGMLTDSLVVVSMNYLVQPFTAFGCGDELEVSISQMDNTFIYADGRFSFSIEGTQKIVDEVGTRDFVINHRKIEVVTATQSWPNASELDDIEVALPEVLSNVENGTGVVAGIARRIVPLGPRIPPCE